MAAEEIGYPSSPQSCGISCAQIAIIPMNSVIDASAAASSTKIFNIACLLGENIQRTMFSFCSKSQGSTPGRFCESRLNEAGWLMRGHGRQDHPKIFSGCTVSR
jgi:hypothetical protein